MKDRMILKLALAGLFVAIIGCGGGGSITTGGGGNGGNGGGGGSTMTMTVTCPGQIQIGVVSPTYQCTATETATWSVDNSALATITQSGVLTPNATTTGILTVTATPTGGGQPASTTVKVNDTIVFNILQSIYITDSVLKADGSNPPVKLTSGCYNAEWFIDHLSFVCSSAVGNSLFVYKTDGTASGTALSATLTWPNIAPDLASPSPDGKTLAFRAYDATSNRFGTYKANIDGSGLQALSQEAVCTGSCVGIGQPRFSNDGEKIVYTHVITGLSMVCVMNADGTDQSCLVPGGSGAFNNAGTEILFNDASGNLLEISSNGGTASELPTPITDAGVAMFSPNNTKIVFGSNLCDICTANADGSDSQTLSSVGGHGSW